MSKYENKQRLPAEAEYHDELERLRQLDQHPVPPGWRMSPVAVGKFVEGCRTGAQPAAARDARRQVPAL